MSKTDSTAPIRAAIYARISKDRGGEGAGVERQIADCEALAARLGWDVVARFVDNDISAYSRTPRPQYQQMLTAARNGVINAVAAWHPDRLYRRSVDLEEIVAVAEENDLLIQTARAGQVDVSTPSGRVHARIIASVAQGEIEQTRDRMRRAKQQAAEQGLYRGGPRPFGYEYVDENDRTKGMQVREAEAEVIREATKAILAGRTLAGVARELNAKSKIKTSSGNDWTYSRLRDVLVRPRNAGLLGKGNPAHGEVEIVGRAVWPAIIDEDTWRAVYRLLNDPSRRKQNGNDTRWLGSGIYTCSLCGAKMRVAPYGGTHRSSNRQRRHLYRCPTLAHLTVRADYTDEHILSVVADLVRDPRVVAAMQPDVEDHLAADRDRRRVLTARLEAFEDDYANGLVNGAQLQKATATITAELDAVDARLAAGMQQSVASPVINSVDPGQAFLDAPLDVQRAVLRAVVRVEVLPNPKRGGAWTAERLRVTPGAS